MKLTPLDIYDAEEADSKRRKRLPVTPVAEAAAAATDPERFVDPAVQAERDTERRRILGEEAADPRYSEDDRAAVRRELSRMPGGPVKAVETKPPKKWAEVAASKEFKALSGDEQEAARQEYWRDVVAPNVPTEDLPSARAEFDASTKRGAAQKIGDELSQIGSDLVRGAKSALAGSNMAAAAYVADRLNEARQQVEWFEANGATDAKEYAYWKGQLDNLTKQAGQSVPVAVSRATEAQDYAEKNPPRAAVTKMTGAKTFGEAFDAFKEAPYDAIAGVTAESAPSMVPALVAGAINPVLGVGTMGASSGVTEFGSSLSDFARKQGVDVRNEKALRDFLSDPDTLKQALAFAGTRAGIIAAADAATAGLASKTMAPKAITSAAGKQLVNIPTQMAVQAAGGAGGEAGAQLATEGAITEPGAVVAEAVGELGGAPAEVAAFGGHARTAAKQLKTQAQSIKDILAEQPAPAAAPVPQLGFDPGRPQPGNFEVVDDTIKALPGTGGQPRLPPPGAPPAGPIVVDSQGNATAIPPGAEAELAAQRQERADLGLTDDVVRAQMARQNPQPEPQPTQTPPPPLQRLPAPAGGPQPVAVAGREVEMRTPTAQEAVDERQNREAFEAEMALLGNTPDVRRAQAYRNLSAKSQRSIPEGVTVRATETGFEALKNGKVIGRLTDNLQQGQAEALGENANVDMVRVDDAYRGTGVGALLYAAFNEKHGGRIAPSGKTSPSAWSLWKRQYPNKVTAFVRQEADRIRGGADPQLVLGNITDPEVAQRVMRVASGARDIGAASVSRPTKGMGRERLSRVVAAFGEKMKGLGNLKVEVVDTAQDLPQFSDEPGIEGYYDPATGTVYLNAAGIPNERRARVVLAHEVIGHHGVEGLIAMRSDKEGGQFEANWNRLLEDTARVARAKNNVGNGVDPGHPDYATMEAVQADYRGISDRQAAREVLARIAETGQRPNLLDRAVELVRRLLRRAGLDLNYSRAELRKLVEDAARSVREGKNVTLNTEQLQQMLNVAKRTEKVQSAKEKSDVSRNQESARSDEADAGQVPQRRGVQGGDQSVESDGRASARPDYPAPGLTLSGLPGKVEVNGVERQFGAFKPAHDAAREYMRGAGLPYNPPTRYVKLDRERARRIAAAYERMEHNPNAPEVKAAYEALVKETLAQWQVIKKTGLKVEFIDLTQGDPYTSPRDALLDIVENNHLWTFRTEDGFGTDDRSASLDTPMLKPVEGETISGQTPLVNDIFRIVHDYFGHAKDGVGFRAEGEENAWQQHAAMYSPLARKAAATELRGQNSWVNYGPHASTNQTASPSATIYAEQKVGLLPQWVVDEGRVSGKNEPMYASRPVTNAAEIAKWARSQGFTDVVDDMHVTLAYSRDPVDMGAAGNDRRVVSIDGGKREVKPLGDQGAIVLKFDSPELKKRWQQFRDAGASWDYESFQPHVTITYNGQGVDLSKVKPYEGKIELGDEKTEPLKLDGASSASTSSGSPIWRSALRDRFLELKTKAADAQGWKDQIKGLVNKGLVKQDEVEWSAINEFLDAFPGKITKEDIDKYLSGQGSILLDDTMLTEAPELDYSVVAEEVQRRLNDLWGEELNSGRAYDRLEYDDYYYVDEETESVEDDDGNEEEKTLYIVRSQDGHRSQEFYDQEEAQAAADSMNDSIRDEILYEYESNWRDDRENDVREQVEQDMQEEHGVQYSEYRQKGGTNYRELLIEIDNHQPKVFKPAEAYANVMHPDGWIHSTYTRERAEEVAKHLNEQKPGFTVSVGTKGAPIVERQRQRNFESSHWDDHENVLAHVRLTDRTDDKGNKVLFVEEIQSDWAQIGREDGFSVAASPSELERLREALDQARKAYRDAPFDNDTKEQEAIHAAERAYKQGLGESGVPRAPFVTKTEAWVSLALKRIIKLAVDEGYDRVAIVNGQQAANNFGLERHIKTVRLQKHGTQYMLESTAMDGRRLQTQWPNNKQELAGMVGQELAEKLVGQLEEKYKPVDAKHAEVMQNQDFDTYSVYDSHGTAISRNYATAEEAEEARGMIRDGSLAPQPRYDDAQLAVTLSGLDLKAGGEGMRGFYDKIVPATLKTVLKKTGGGEPIKFGVLGVERQDGGSLVQQIGFDVTDKMRETAANGLPAFSKRMPHYKGTIEPMKREYSSGPLDWIAKKAGGELAGKYILGPLYKRVTDFGGRVIPERVKAGFVSDYGLPEPYIDMRIDRNSGVNRMQRRAKNVLDKLSGLTRDESKVAYLWMNEKPDTAAEKKLMAALPEKSRDTMREMKNLVDELGREAVKVGLLSKESYERNRMAYLHRSYAKHEANGDSTMAVMKRNAAIRADTYKGRGITDRAPLDWLVQDADEVSLGQLMRRMERRSADQKLLEVAYVPMNKPIPARMAGWREDGMWEVRSLDEKGDKALMWRDLSKQEREAAGEIDEVRYAFAKTVVSSIRDIENARFLKWVADNHGVDRDSIDDDKLAEPSEGFMTLKTYRPDEYVTVPETVIPKTGGIKRYGALAGKTIPGPMWNDVRNAMATPESEVGKVLNTIMRHWKISKTALSPATHTNNVMSNFILADMADVGARDVARALKVMIDAKRGNDGAKELIERFEDSGADSGSFSTVELNEKWIEPVIRDLLQQQADDTLGKLTAANVVGLIFSGRLKDAAGAIAAKGSKLKRPFEAMIQAYRSEDTVFRLAKFQKELKAGATDREAGKAARDAFLNYDINAPWINAARRGPLPFLAFSYRAIPLMMRTAATKPWKAAKYTAVFGALNAASYAMLGSAGDEDEEKRLQAEELQGKMFGIFPRLMRMPWNDSNGSPVFLDVRRWVPGGDMVDVSGSKASLPLPPWLSIGGPLSLAADLSTNTSSFTGKPIVKGTDTAGERAAKVGDVLFKFAAPNLPVPGPGHVIPGLDRGQMQTYSWQGLLDAGKGRTDAFGREGELPTAAMSAVGVKAKSYPQDVARYNITGKMAGEQAEVRENIRAIQREFAKKGISREEFERRMDREMGKLKKSGQDAKQKLNP